MIGEDILKAAELLKQGETVAIPTETVYGLAANALDSDAVVKIFKVKNRPFFDPLIVHTNSIEKIRQWVQEIPDEALALAQAFWPGPLTLVLKKTAIIPDLVTAGNGTVAVRIPNHALTLQLLSQLDFPLAAPSANPFGYISPTTAEHVEDQLGASIPYILDGGACKVGLESTIVSFAGNKPAVLRLGGLSLEKLKEVLPDFDIHINQHSNPQAPGQMDVHYAPSTHLILGDIEKSLENFSDPGNIGIISFSNTYSNVPVENQVQLSKKRNLDEAAGNVFSALRIMDKKGLKIILAEPMPNEGLGRAINDRLRRAAFKK